MEFNANVDVASFTAAGFSLLGGGRPILEDDVLIGAVAVDEEGGWVGKGYGFPQAWFRVEAPFATLAHPVMVYPRLPVPPERRVHLIATPQRLLRLG